VFAFGVYFAYGARREERDMLAQFPEQYAAYRRRTKMFVPFLF
jgi:protein-S-isoprenylcysteine O-methyltransferase Ste14